MDSSAFFEYPGSTAATGSASGGNARFLGDLREDEVRDVLGCTQVRRYARGELAIHQGDTDQGLYMITAGCFEVVEPVADVPRRKALLQSGDIFGELAFSTINPIPPTCVRSSAPRRSS